MIIHKTKRMAIWVFDYCPSKDNGTRTMFVGVPRDQDWPFAAVVASVMETTILGGTAYLDMIQTNPIMARKGYATDMVDFLAEQFKGPLGADEHSGAVRLRRIKGAPRRHATKIQAPVVEHAMSVSYWRFWKEVGRNGKLERKLAQ